MEPGKDVGAGEGQRETGGALRQGGLVISAGVWWGNRTISVHNPDNKKTAETIHIQSCCQSQQGLGKAHKRVYVATTLPPRQGISPSAKKSKPYRGEVCPLAHHGFIINDGGVLQD